MLGDVLDDVWTTGRGNRSEQSPGLEKKQFDSVSGFGKQRESPFRPAQESLTVYSYTLRKTDTYLREPLHAIRRDFRRVGFRVAPVKRNPRFRCVLFQLIERARSKRIRAHKRWFEPLFLIVIRVLRARRGLAAALRDKKESVSLVWAISRRNVVNGKYLPAAPRTSPRLFCPSPAGSSAAVGQVGQRNCLLILSEHLAQKTLLVHIQ